MKTEERKLITIPIGGRPRLDMPTKEDFFSMKEKMTVKELASHFGVSVMTLYRWRDRYEQE